MVKEGYFQESEKSCWLCSKKFGWRLSDERAEACRLSNADPICIGPNKQGSLQHRIKSSQREVAEDELNFPVHGDEAPNKKILRQTIHANLLPACKLHNTVFTREVLVQQHGAVVRKVIGSCLQQPRLPWHPCSLLDESNYTDPSCDNISARNQFDEIFPFL